ncbi:glycosyltransferase [Microbacterium soli]|uniref:glycosyltransferase n=1 Tax=Microbacterium soli TaxID=446075 RepID=UPI0031DF65C4
MSRIFAPEPAAAAPRLAAVAQALTDAGAEVTVITTTVPGMTGGPETDDSAPYDVRCVPALRDRDGYIRGYVNYMSFDIPAFFRLVFSKRFDAVIVEPPPTTGVFIRAAAWLRRTPYLFYAADVWSEAADVAGTPKVMVSVVRAFEDWAYRGAARVLSMSASVSRRVSRSASGARVETVGNGYDSTVFRPDGPRIERSPCPLYAGTASEVHGAGVFVDAMPLLLTKHPEDKLVFIGQGADWSVGEDVSDIAAAMIEVFSAQGSSARRLELAERTRQRLSLQSVGARVADAVGAVI